MSTVRLDQLCKQLDETPEDKLLFGVIADYMEEQGDKRANGMRWLQTKGIKLCRDGNEIDGNLFLYDHTTHGGDFRWYSHVSLIELVVWNELDRSKMLEGIDFGYAQYKTKSEAILDLANAYVKLQEKTK